MAHEIVHGVQDEFLADEVDLVDPEKPCRLFDPVAPVRHELVHFLEDFFVNLGQGNGMIFLYF
jgi:hypothetical protein